MADKSWKVAERLIAHRLCGPAGCRVVRHKGGKGVDFGDIGIEMSDGTVMPPFGIRVEVKHRKAHQAFNYWRQIQKVAKSGCGHLVRCIGPIPIVCLREHGSPRTLVVLDLEDVERFGAYLAEQRS